MKKLRKILREAGTILFASAASESWLAIMAAPFWWDEPPATVSRILLCSILAFVLIYTAASLNSEYRLVVRVERRVR